MLSQQHRLRSFNHDNPTRTNMVRQPEIKPERSTVKPSALLFKMHKDLIGLAKIVRKQGLD